MPNDLRWAITIVTIVNWEERMTEASERLRRQHNTEHEYYNTTGVHRRFMEIQYELAATRMICKYMKVCYHGCLTFVNYTLQRYTLLQSIEAFPYTKKYTVIYK